MLVKKGTREWHAMMEMMSWAKSLTTLETNVDGDITIPSPLFANIQEELEECDSGSETYEDSECASALDTESQQSNESDEPKFMRASLYRQ